MAQENLEWVPFTNIRLHIRVRAHSQQPLADLAASMKTYTQLQPGRGRRLSDGAVELYIGHGRYLAAKSLGWESLQLIVVDQKSDEDLDLEMLHENLKREDLDPVTEASEFEYMMKAHKWSQADMGEKAGVTQQEISRVMALLTLTPEVRDLTRQGVISKSHGFHISKLKDEGMQKEVAKEVVDKGLTVEQTEKLVKARLAGPKKDKVSTSALNLSAVWPDLTEGVTGKLEKGWVTLRWSPKKYPNTRELLQKLSTTAPDQLIVERSQQKADSPGIQAGSSEN